MQYFKYAYNRLRKICFEKNEIEIHYGMLLSLFTIEKSAKVCFLSSMRVYNNNNVNFK